MTQIETAPYYRRENGKNGQKKHPPSLEPPQLVFFLASIAVAGVVRLADKHQTAPHGIVGRIEWLRLEPLEPPFRVPSLQYVPPL